MRTTTLLIALLLLARQPAVAGELRLGNGARIPGEFSRMEGGKLVWNAALIGEIRVETSSITAIDSAVATDLLVRDSAALSACRMSGGATEVALQCAGGKQARAPWRELGVAPAVNTGSGKITASLTRERGNNYSDEYEGDARASWIRAKRRHRLEASIDYERKRDRTSEDEASLSYQMDYLLRDRWYAYGKLDFTRDRYEAVQESTTGGVGIGRSFRPAPQVELMLQAGPDLVHFDLQDFGRAVEEGGDVQWRLNWKTGLWRLGFDLFHEAEYRWLLTDADVSRLESKTGISIPLVDGLVAELRLDYDRVGMQIQDIDNTDAEWVFALGYRW